MKQECLYTVLNLPPRGTPENKKLTPEQIRKAYRLAALDFHPDKNSSEHAQAMFLQISAAYKVLSEPSQKKEYDRTGKTDAQNDVSPESYRSADWMQAFRHMFEEVSGAEIDAFYATYIGSLDEEVDTIQAYELCKGNFEDMANRFCMFPNEVGQIERLVTLCHTLIKANKIKKNALFTRTTTPVAIAKIEEYLSQERQMAELEAKKLKETYGSVASKGQKRNRSSLKKEDEQLTLFNDKNKFESFLDALSAKYGAMEEEVEDEDEDEDEEEQRPIKKKRIQKPPAKKVVHKKK